MCVVYLYLFIFICNPHIDTCICIYMHAYIYIYVCVYLCVYTYMCICIFYCDYDWCVFLRSRLNASGSPWGNEVRPPLETAPWCHPWQCCPHVLDYLLHFTFCIYPHPFSTCRLLPILLFISHSFCRRNAKDGKNVIVLDILWQQ